MLPFTDCEHPTMTVMLKNFTLESLLDEVAEAIDEGAEAIGYEFSSRPATLKTDDAFDAVFSAIGGRPIYLCNYRRTSSDKSLSDEILAEQLIRALEIAKRYSETVAIDVAGNLYDPSPIEISYEPDVIARQQRLIGEIHARGGLALMSSHMFKFMPSDDVLALARTHIERGADISKIVTDANSQSELDANLATSLKLKSELGAPHLFLCNGSHCRAHRILSPRLGSSMALCVVNSAELQNQPRIARYRELNNVFASHEMK